MLQSLISHWLFWALLSSFFTAILFHYIGGITKGSDAATSATFRSLSMTVVLLPFAFYVTYWQQKSNALRFLEWSNWKFLLGLALFGAASWFTTHKAFEVAPSQGVNNAAVVAINYTSVIIVMLFTFLDGTYVPNWKNWLGVVLVVAGSYLVSAR